MAGVFNPFSKAAPLTILLAASLYSQAPGAPPQGGVPSTGVPLYRVTVVDRTVKAINYQYRSGPTMINFRGTVLLPYAKGEAVVEARQGRVDIDAKIEGLLPTQRFGGEYLTYVLWAITPEGRPHNIGELVSDTSNKGRLHVTTDLQAFALVVTAEPYSAVRTPSDVVVAENEVRPDTVGTIEQVNARFELLPRGQYTMQLSNASAAPEGPKLTMHQYEAATEVYQAQNALSIAANAGAERYAPDVYARAQQLLTTAQQIQTRKGDYRQVVQSAREAAQTAEDARVIAAQHRDTDQLNQAKAEIVKARTELASAQQDRQAALAQAREAEDRLAAARATDNARAQAQVQLDAQAQADAAALRARDAQRPVVQSTAAQNADAQERAAENRYQGQMAGQRELRGRVFNEMKSALPTLDSGRGLIATLPDDGFHGANVLDVPSTRVAALARVLARHPGLIVSVEGYSAAADGETLSRDRATAVRRVLVASGLPANSVTAEGLGDSRPLGSNATAQGRRANARVEIVVNGNSVGNVPLWEQSNLSRPAPIGGVPAGRAE